MIIRTTSNQDILDIRELPFAEREAFIQSTAPEFRESKVDQGHYDFWFENDYKQSEERLLEQQL